MIYQSDNSNGTEAFAHAAYFFFEKNGLILIISKKCHVQGQRPETVKRAWDKRSAG